MTKLSRSFGGFVLSRAGCYLSAGCTPPDPYYFEYLLELTPERIRKISPTPKRDTPDYLLWAWVNTGDNLDLCLFRDSYLRSVFCSHVYPLSEISCRILREFCGDD